LHSVSPISRGQARIETDPRKCKSSPRLVLFVLSLNHSVPPAPSNETIAEGRSVLELDQAFVWLEKGYDGRALQMSSLKSSRDGTAFGSVVARRVSFRL
jgi:hypothetical protein